MLSSDCGNKAREWTGTFMNLLQTMFCCSDFRHLGKEGLESEMIHKYLWLYWRIMIECFADDAQKCWSLELLSDFHTSQKYLLLCLLIFQAFFLPWKLFLTTSLVSFSLRALMPVVQPPFSTHFQGYPSFLTELMNASPMDYACNLHI